MGRDVEATQFSREDRTRYRQKVRQCLDVIERMLAQSQFDFEKPLTGVEPLVEKTYRQPTILGECWTNGRATRESGTTWTRLFLVRSFGIVHMV